MGPLVLEKIFEGFLPYALYSSHLSHVTWITYVHIGYRYLEMLHIELGFDWPCSFRGEEV